MPKIIYRPFDRLDPMLNEAPTRYSPRSFLKPERAQASSDKNKDARQNKDLHRGKQEKK
jgi:hypothetical protein